jgi:hypothetical protein
MFDPILPLYLALAFASAVATAVTRRAGHCDLSRVYLAFTLIYAALGLCRWLGF